MAKSVSLVFYYYLSQLVSTNSTCRANLNKTDILELRDDFGFTCLHWSCAYKDYQTSKYILQLGANPNTQTTVDKLTGLHLAVTPMKCFYDYPLDIYSIINDNDYKFENSTFLIVKLLLQRKAQVNIPDKMGITPLLFYYLMPYSTAKPHSITNLFNSIAEFNTDDVINIIMYSSSGYVNLMACRTLQRSVLAARIKHGKYSRKSLYFKYKECKSIDSINNSWTYTYQYSNSFRWSLIFPTPVPLLLMYVQSWMSACSNYSYHMGISDKLFTYICEILISFKYFPSAFQLLKSYHLYNVLEFLWLQRNQILTDDLIKKDILILLDNIIFSFKAQLTISTHEIYFDLPKRLFPGLALLNFFYQNIINNTISDISWPNCQVAEIFSSIQYLCETKSLNIVKIISYNNYIHGSPEDMLLFLIQYDCDCNIKDRSTNQTILGHLAEKLNSLISSNVSKRFNTKSRGSSYIKLIALLLENGAYPLILENRSTKNAMYILNHIENKFPEFVEANIESFKIIKRSKYYSKPYPLLSLCAMQIAKYKIDIVHMSIANRALNTLKGSKLINFINLHKLS